MQVSPEDIEDFKRIYTAEFGELLSNAEAGEMAGRLLDLYSLLAEPLPSEQASAAMPPPEGTRPPSPL